MRNALISKLSDKSTVLALLLGAALASLAAQSCSVDTSKYTFVDEFPDASTTTGGDTNNGGGANGGGAHAGSANGGGADAGDSNLGAGTTGSPNCTVGEHACSDDGHLQTCQAGTPPAFDTGKACGDGKCSASQGICLKCAPGEFQCVNNELQQCNIFGSAFEDTEACDSKAACVASGQKGYCVRCKPGVDSCEASDVHVLASDDDKAIYSSNRLVTCNADGSGTDTAQTCLAESAICDATNKKCLSCEPNAYFCDGSTLNQCSADGSNYMYKLSCNSPAVCDAANAKCTTPANPGCNQGAYQCVGAALQVCNGGAWQPLDTCGSNNLCDANAGRCQVCAQNSYTCLNNNVQACGSNYGQAFTYTPQQCAADQCVQSGQSANCAVCRPGSIACYDGSQGYSVCSANGLQPASCPRDTSGTQMVCSSALQKCVSCLPDQYSCDNQVLKRCASDGSASTVVEDCAASGTQCDAGRGLCMNRQPGQSFCDDKGNLFTVSYDANHAVTNQLVEACGAPNLCDSGSGVCRAKRCVIGQLTCSGADVYSCDTGDQRNRTGTRCTSISRCQDGFGCVKVLGIAAGDAHTCAIVAGSDAVEGDPGYVMCWGANESGQLGDGSPLLADSKEARPVLVRSDPNKPDSSDSRLAAYFTSVCAGKNFTCAQLAIPNAQGGSRVACWGSNEKGQLGVDFADPGPYNGPYSLVTDDATKDDGIDLHALTCGAEFACALGTDGSPWCWGANESGQLGLGSAVNGIAAANIAGAVFTQIAAGARHVCGVKADSSVWCWGDGSSGQLGSGLTKGATVPTSIGKLLAASDRAPALGNDFSLALSTKASKNPFAWGANTFGQLGNQTTDSSLLPGALSGLLSSDFLSAGTLYSGATAEHACARIADRLYCWGANVFGEVGNGSTDDTGSPQQIFDGKTTLLAPGAHSVAVGGRHTCALTAKGDVMCWGANHRSQLGSTAVTPQRTPLKAF